MPYGFYAFFLWIAAVFTGRWITLSFHGRQKRIPYVKDKRVVREYIAHVFHVDPGNVAIDGITARWDGRGLHHTALNPKQPHILTVLGEDPELAAAAGAGGAGPAGHNVGAMLEKLLLRCLHSGLVLFAARHGSALLGIPSWFLVVGALMQHADKLGLACACALCAKGAGIGGFADMSTCWLLAVASGAEVAQAILHGSPNRFNRMATAVDGWAAAYLRDLFRPVADRLARLRHSILGMWLQDVAAYIMAYLLARCLKHVAVVVVIIVWYMVVRPLMRHQRKLGVACLCALGAKTAGIGGAYAVMNGRWLVAAACMAEAAHVVLHGRGGAAAVGGAQAAAPNRFNRMATAVDGWAAAYLRDLFRPVADRLARLRRWYQQDVAALGAVAPDNAGVADGADQNPAAGAAGNAAAAAGGAAHGAAGDGAAAAGDNGGAAEDGAAAAGAAANAAGLNGGAAEDGAAAAGAAANAAGGAGGGGAAEGAAANAAGANGGADAQAEGAALEQPGE